MSRFEEQVEEVARHRALGNAEARRPVIEPVFKPAEGFADPNTEVRKPRKALRDDFASTAALADTLRNAMRGSTPDAYKASHRLALEQIIGRLARIGEGGQNAREHWQDIAYWASLMAEQLE